MAAGTNPPVTEVDTTYTSGHPGEASSGTQYEASNRDTENTGGGSRKVEPTSPPVTEYDTSGTNSANTHFVPTSTALHSETNTLNSGAVDQTDRAYRAPSGPVAASTRDTTRTDIEKYTGPNIPATTANQHGTIETASIGVAGSSIAASVPAKPAAPTATPGPRGVTVSWAAVADVPGGEVLDYVVQNNRGGHTFAPRNATSILVTNLDPSYSYSFQVAARNNAGLSAYSDPSGTARPYNPDEPDVLKPGGLAPANVTNPIYRPDGSIKPGTGGTNNAPVLGAVTPGAAGSKTVTVNWSAPTVGNAPTGYTIKASDGSTFSAAAGATSKACVFAASGASVTFTVTATNAQGTGATSTPSAAVTVP